MKNLRDHIELTAEKAQIEADMKYAVTLDFGPYLGYLGAYGQTLDRMASEYQQHEIARRILTAYADEALDRANGN
ncbi:hypothetical protein K4B79_12325 [Streptomyces lincolnensis]|uniref:hypothetical protein n=1 Tax=Streptomyces lincolnensis TaxID=1915 RepID=UPI001E3EE21B|nr:hypothetical protein [Streptomyces lincolnensis]MCD7439011.1 hypothetical protein [Streptomyces lincolnensis]